MVFSVSFNVSIGQNMNVDGTCLLASFGFDYDVLSLFVVLILQDAGSD